MQIIFQHKMPTLREIWCIVYRQMITDLVKTGCPWLIRDDCCQEIYLNILQIPDSIAVQVIASEDFIRALTSRVIRDYRQREYNWKFPVPPGYKVKDTLIAMAEREKRSMAKAGRQDDY